MPNKPSKVRFAEDYDVSRETMELLETYTELLRKWNPAINLVSKSTIPSLWDRHFADSAQLLKLTDVNTGLWADLGSGGGFPGMVLAVLCREKRPELQFSLVESDIRKSIFLKSVAQELSLAIDIQSKRIEDLDPLAADILSARALAPLPKLLGYAHQHLNPNGQAIFPKGAKYRQEMQDALEFWSFKAQEFPSTTDENAAVLRFGEITRV